MMMPPPGMMMGPDMMGLGPPGPLGMGMHGDDLMLPPGANGAPPDLAFGFDSPQGTQLPAHTSSSLSFSNLLPSAFFLTDVMNFSSLPGSLGIGMHGDDLMLPLAADGAHPDLAFDFDRPQGVLSPRPPALFHHSVQENWFQSFIMSTTEQALPE